MQKTNDQYRRVCPASHAGALDNIFRRFVQNPQKILAKTGCVREGMTVLDYGCGPGFFSLAMADMVGESGKVIALDLQKEMLQKIREKIVGTSYEKRIILQQGSDSSSGIRELIDFVLAFYVVHELLDQQQFFMEMHTLMRSKGKIFMVEPPMHVSAKAFEKTLEYAKNAKFAVQPGPKVLFSRSVLLVRE